MKLTYSTINLTDAHNKTAPAVPCYVVYYRSYVLALPANLDLAYGDHTPVCLNEIDFVKEEVTRSSVLTLRGWQIKELIAEGKIELEGKEITLRKKVVDDNEMADKAVELLQFFGNTEFDSPRGAFFRHCMQQRADAPQNATARKNLVHWMAALLNDVGETELLLRLIQNKEL